MWIAALGRKHISEEPWQVASSVFAGHMESWLRVSKWDMSTVLLAGITKGNIVHAQPQFTNSPSEVDFS